MTPYIPKYETVHETDHYMVLKNKKTGAYELYEKEFTETPIATHEYSTVLAVAANVLERELQPSPTPKG